MRLALFALSLLSMASAAWADQVTAIQAVRSQPRALDAKVDTSGNLYVVVKADRVPWDMYAGGMCNVVRPHQARIFRVRVVELTKVDHSKPPAAWERLAEASCAR